MFASSAMLGFYLFPLKNLDKQHQIEQRTELFTYATIESVSAVPNR